MNNFGIMVMFSLMLGLFLGWLLPWQVIAILFFVGVAVFIWIVKYSGEAIIVYLVYFSYYEIIVVCAWVSCIFFHLEQIGYSFVNIGSWIN